MAIAPGQSLTLKGFNSSAASQARLNALTTLLTSDSGLSLVQAANNTMANSIADAAALEAALAKVTPLKTQFPTTSLGSQLQQVAQIIQVQTDLGMSRQIFFCSLGGFDTHAGELETHNNLYPQLSQALAAFYAATEELGMADNVTTFTESDFSRTFQPTTADGSDHAWGSHHLVLGGAVKGGQIYGQFPTFELARAQRHRHARALDSDHVHRSIRRDAVLLVRDSRQRAYHRVSQLCEFRIAKARFLRLTAGPRRY